MGSLEASTCRIISENLLMFDVYSVYSVHSTGIKPSNDTAL
jgi:hypothetical protein